MKEYIIRRKPYDRFNDRMVIIERSTGEELAEFKLTAGEEEKEIRQMRKDLDEHLDSPGATLHNYPF